MVAYDNVRLLAVTRAAAKVVGNVGDSSMTREECDEAISAEGEFEGLPVYVPYYYDRGWKQFDYDDSNRFDDVEEREFDEGEWCLFEVSAEEHAKFPELDGVEQVIIQEDDDGEIWVKWLAQPPLYLDTPPIHAACLQ